MEYSVVSPRSGCASGGAFAIDDFLFVLVSLGMIEADDAFLVVGVVVKETEPIGASLIVRLYLTTVFTILDSLIVSVI